MPVPRLIKKRRAAKFESLRLTAFYQMLTLESYVSYPALKDGVSTAKNLVMLLKITWSGLDRNFVRLFFFYPDSLE